MRYVDADNAISVLKILSDKCADHTAFDQAISVLESVFTAEDLAEVVRCKKCVHGKCDGTYCKRLRMPVEQSNFCSFAVRRENGLN